MTEITIREDNRPVAKVSVDMLVNDSGLVKKSLVAAIEKTLDEFQMLKVKDESPEMGFAEQSARLKGRLRPDEKYMGREDPTPDESAISLIEEGLNKVAREMAKKAFDEIMTAKPVDFGVEKARIAAMSEFASSVTEPDAVKADPEQKRTRTHQVKFKIKGKKLKLIMKLFRELKKRDEARKRELDAMKETFKGELKNIRQSLDIQAHDAINQAKSEKLDMILIRKNLDELKSRIDQM